MKGLTTNNFPEIRYNYPKGAPNPFDMNSTDKYFIYASGLSNLSHELEVFNFKNLEKHIPTGYKTILILERITFYLNGQLTPDFNYFNQLTKNDRLYLISNKIKKTHLTEWNRDFESYSILRADSDASLESHIWNDVEDANNVAKKISPEDNSIILISKIVDDIHWH